ncbi:YitT family protein [Clostridium sp. CT7]|uniref:YczE/YyaS/YitT family protein n=2 Tax=Clostridium TaxID=1485 RepID=UPI0012FE564B|nr:YitT family protein [Clostridium sp. CT7]
MLALGIIISAFGMTLLVKSSLGQSTVTAISYNIGIVTQMKTGTVLTLVNYVCFIGQIILLKKEFKLIQVLQLVVTTVFGSVLNVFLYGIPFITNMQLNNYLVKLVVLLIGIIFMAYGVSLMVLANLVFMPYEGLCNVIALKLNVPFGTIRRYVDITFVILSLAIIFAYKIPNTSVREGTVIYTLLLGTLTNVFMKHIK